MNIKKIVYASFFLALGVVFPMVFHYIGGPGLGRILLPMHLPVLIGGAFLGPLGGLILGILTPILSSLFTGMPTVIPMLPIMIGELSIYGLTMGILFKKLKYNIYVSLIITMLLGRIMASFVVLILVYGFSFTQLPTNPVVYIYGTITAGIPGIIGQLIIVPIILIYLNNYRKSNEYSYN